MARMPFTELKIWQKSMELVDRIYKISVGFPREEIFGLTSQCRRSAVSIPSNIAEGSERTSQKEFANFILIAKGSLSELWTQMMIAQRQKFLQEQETVILFKNIEDLRKMLFAFHKALTK